jgi:hypothetical protein
VTLSSLSLTVVVSVADSTGHDAPPVAASYASPPLFCTALNCFVNRLKLWKLLRRHFQTAIDSLFVYNDFSFNDNNEKAISVRDGCL